MSVVVAVVITNALLFGTMSKDYFYKRFFKKNNEWSLIFLIFLTVYNNGGATLT